MRLILLYKDNSPKKSTHKISIINGMNVYSLYLLTVLLTFFQN